MGRPKATPEEKRSVNRSFKLTPEEDEAYRALVLAVQGPIPVRDSDVIRFLIREACEKRGIAWPGAPKPKKGSKR